MADDDVQYVVEPHPSQVKRWRVVRVEGDSRIPLACSNFRKELTALKYAKQVKEGYWLSQNRRRRPYLGD